MLLSSYPGVLSIQPKVPEISVGTSNGTDHFGLVWLEYLGPALKVVHFDQTNRNVPFHLTKLFPQYPSFVSYLQEQ